MQRARGFGKQARSDNLLLETIVKLLDMAVPAYKITYDEDDIARLLDMEETKNGKR